MGKQTVDGIHIGTERLKRWLKYCKRLRENPNTRIKSLINADLPAKERVNEGIQFKKGK